MKGKKKRRERSSSEKDLKLASFGGGLSREGLSRENRDDLRGGKGRGSFSSLKNPGGGER